MIESEAMRLVTYLFAKHDMQDYSFGWSNGKRQFGHCNYQTKTIKLSWPLTQLNEYERVQNTILHEIAHAKTEGHHHDKVWKKKFIEIGGDGRRTYESALVAKPKAKWIGYCTCREFPAYARRTRLRCTMCGTGIQYKINT